MKATLLLVPLLGISNVPLFYEPEEWIDSGVYQLISASLQYSQVCLHHDVSNYIMSISNYIM